jgi:hypothetical protein
MIAQVQTSFVRVDGDLLRRTPFQESRAEIISLSEWSPVEQSLQILSLLDRQQLDIPTPGLRGMKIQIRRVEDGAEPSFAGHCIWIQPPEKVAFGAMTRAQAIILAFPSAGVLDRWCDCFCKAGGTIYSLDERDDDKVAFSRGAFASAFRRVLQSAWHRT